MEIYIFWYNFSFQIQFWKGYGYVTYTIRLNLILTCEFIHM